MGWRLIQIIAQSDKKLKLKKNEVLDLPKLQQECLRRGITSTIGKGRIYLTINQVNFQLFADGNIARCYAPNEDSMDAFDSSIIDFFWQNFAVNCIKKKEMK